MTYKKVLCIDNYVDDGSPAGSSLEEYLVINCWYNVLGENDQSYFVINSTGEIRWFLKEDNLFITEKESRKLKLKRLGELKNKI